MVGRDWTPRRRNLASPSSMFLIPTQLPPHPMFLFLVPLPSPNPMFLFLICLPAILCFYSRFAYPSSYVLIPHSAILQSYVFIRDYPTPQSYDLIPGSSTPPLPKLWDIPTPNACAPTQQVLCQGKGGGGGFVALPPPRTPPPGTRTRTHTLRVSCGKGL